MAVLLDIRPDASTKEQIRHLRDQLEIELNGMEERMGSTTVIVNPGGGGGSVSSYLQLSDKPQIEGVTLQGNKTYEELNLERLTNSDIEELLSNTDVNV